MILTVMLIHDDTAAIIIVRGFRDIIMNGKMQKLHYSFRIYIANSTRTFKPPSCTSDSDKWLVPPIPSQNVCVSSKAFYPELEVQYSVKSLSTWATGTEFKSGHLMTLSFLHVLD